MPRYLYNGSRYPVILGGSGYVTTRPAAKCLFNESMKLPFFHLEDVFLTGFAAENCAIPRYEPRRLLLPNSLIVFVKIDFA